VFYKPYCIIISVENELCCTYNADNFLRIGNRARKSRHNRKGYECTIDIFAVWQAKGYVACTHRNIKSKLLTYQSYCIKGYQT